MSKVEELIAKAKNGAMAADLEYIRNMLANVRRHCYADGVLRCVACDNSLEVASDAASTLTDLAPKLAAMLERAMWALDLLTSASSHMDSVFARNTLAEIAVMAEGGEA